MPKSNLLQVVVPAVLGLIAVPTWADIVDDCLNQANSQQYAKAENLGRQAVKQTGSLSAHLCLGQALHKQGKSADALPVLQAAANLARSDQQIALAANWLGNAYSDQGDYDAALEQHNRELTIAKRLKDKASEATALNNVANAYDNKGDSIRALRYYEESLRIQPEENSKTVVLNNIALILNKRGEHKLAISRLEEAVAIDRRLGNHHAMGIHLINLGEIRRQTQDWLGAMRDLEEGLTYVRQVGDKGWEAIGHVKMAHLQEAQGRLPAAQTSWQIASKLYRSIAKTDKANWAEEKAARLTNAKGCEGFRVSDKADLAQVVAEAAIKKSAKDASAWLCLGKVQHVQENYATAIQSFTQALRYSSDKAEKADALYWAGHAYRFNNDWENARKSSLQGVALARETQRVGNEVGGLQNLIIVERDAPNGNKTKLPEHCMALDVIPGEQDVLGWTWQSCGKLSEDAGDNLVAARRFGKAAKAYQKAKQFVDEGVARVWLGKALKNDAPHDRAKQELKQGIKLLTEATPALNPEDMAFWKGHAHYYLGEIAEAEGSKDETKHHYRIALEAARIKNWENVIKELDIKLAQLELPATTTVASPAAGMPEKTGSTEPDTAGNEQNSLQKTLSGLAGKLLGGDKQGSK